MRIPAQRCNLIQAKATTDSGEACRTYGFYVQRDKGLYCKDIETQVDSGRLDNVVWGNQGAIEELLKHPGETRKLTEWFDDWKILNWKIF